MTPTPAATTLFETLRNILKQLDVNNNGCIEFSEFKGCYIRLNPLATEADARRVFETIDRNNSRSISLIELGHYYGFKFKNEKLEGDVDTSGMSDEKLIELMHLNSIASDNARQVAAAQDSTARTARIRHVQGQVEEQNRQHTLANAHRLDKERKASVVGDAAGLLAARMGEPIKGQGAQPEIDFLESCALGDYDAIEQAIKAGVNCLVCDDKKESALHKICRVGGKRCTSIAGLLLQKGVSLNYQERNGKTAAHFAAEYGHASVLAWLLGKGADPSIRTTEGWTVLHEACFHSDKGCCELLLHMHKGPAVNALDMHGRTALHIAAYRASEEIVHLLIDCGADPCVEDEHHLSAGKLAARTGRRASAQLLESLEAKEGGEGAPAAQSPDRHRSSERRKSTDHPQEVNQYGDSHVRRASDAPPAPKAHPKP